VDVNDSDCLLGLGPEMIEDVLGSSAKNDEVVMTRMRKRRKKILGFRLDADSIVT